MDCQSAILQRLHQALLMLTLGIVFPLLQALEKGQQLSIWPILSRLALGWCGLGSNGLLQREVRLQVELRRLD